MMPDDDLHCWPIYLQAQFCEPFMIILLSKGNQEFLQADHEKIYSTQKPGIIFLSLEIDKFMWTPVCLK